MRRPIDWTRLSTVYGALWNECRAENTPNPVDAIPAGAVEKNWETLRAALALSLIHI